MMRRQFQLPEADQQFLETLGLSWETIVEGKVRWLVLHDYPLPVGYNQQKTTVAIQIGAGYPPGKLDMAWFSPPLARKDGRPIPALSAHVIDGKQFQRWSRHYAWVEGEHDLDSHLVRVWGWLEAELKR